MCKRGDAFSLAVLIGRGLDFVFLFFFFFSLFVQFLGCENKQSPFGSHLIVTPFLYLELKNEILHKKRRNYLFKRRKNNFIGKNS